MAPNCELICFTGSMVPHSKQENEWEAGDIQPQVSRSARAVAQPSLQSLLDQSPPSNRPNNASVNTGHCPQRVKGV